jgi:hypothetical protein
MPIKRALERHTRIISPSEIDMLQRVFDKTSVPDEMDAERQDRAFRLVNAFQNGISDENELMSLFQQPRKI